MPTVLAIDSTTKNCSVALFKNFNLIDSISQNGSYSHAENLGVFIDQILQKNEIEYAEISAIAVGMGPGSYTGLRIGASLAKGLALGLNIPIIGIDTLESMAHGAMDSYSDEDILFCPMIDARRMEVYTAIFDFKGEQIEHIQAKLIDEDSFRSLLMKNKILFFGDGSNKCKEKINHESAVFLDESYISAVHFEKQIESKYKTESFLDTAYFEPFYLKEFQGV